MNRILMTLESFTAHRSGWLGRKTRPVLNIINRRMGVLERPLDEPIDETIMTGYKSNSGEGYASATGGLSELPILHLKMMTVLVI